jgi:hypothetical protein
MENFPIKKTEHPKIRLGRRCDGGYVICDIPKIKYDLFLSGGICDDISFEEAFLKKYPSLKCIAFDGTIDSLPSNHPHIQFVKKNIGGESSDSLTNLKEYMAGHNNIFLKMDIEGHEEFLFKSFSESDIQKFAQIAIEVHFGTKYTIASCLKNTHYLVHFHPNNALKIGYDNLPHLIELTYVRKDLCSVANPSTDPIPNRLLDIKNIADNKDIILRNGVFELETFAGFKFSLKSGKIEPQFV